MNQESYREEAEYIIYLLHERRLYAWCLITYGQMAVDESYREAGTLYRYYSIDEEDREDIFQEEAWHWAMLKLYGNEYARKFPQLAAPSYEYSQESDRIFGYE
ncbi:MAG: hypothetical protein AAF490_15925 [Chloroflexota bacterium]